MDCTVRLSIWPWTDPDFVQAAENAFVWIQELKDVEPSSVAATALAESFLRDRGFPSARVIDRRTIDEAMRHVVHWQVLRDAG